MTATATTAWATALDGLPTVAALGALARTLTRPRPARRAHATTVCAALSLATTFGFPALGHHASSGWKLAEAVVLVLLVAAVTRWAPRRELRAAVPAAASAVALWPVPLIDGSILERAGAAAFWLLPALAAVAAGAYPRRLDLRRRTAVAQARRAQRSQLSRDLHDFVAHDVSGIVVQAQAARFVAATDPAQAVLALERIEKAGLNALAAMDRAVEMLHGTESSPKDAVPGLARLPSLVDDFTSAGATAAELGMSPEASGALSREAGAAAYRIVVEALTNIRRHAPTSPRARITLTSVPAGVEVRVTNDAPAPGRSTVPRVPRARRTRGGLGLPALTEHAEALGGTLTAGPDENGGWRLTAVLPRTAQRQEQGQKQ